MTVLQPRLTRRFPDLKRSLSTSVHRRQVVRVSTAPKQYPDIKNIRSNVDLYEQNAVLRRYNNHRGAPRRIEELVSQSSEVIQKANSARGALKSLEQKVATLKSNKDEAAAAEVLRQILPLRKTVDMADDKRNALQEEAKMLALSLPNLTSSETPPGDEPKLLSYINYDPAKPPVFDTSAVHSEIGQQLGILDFVSASTTTGWGFYYLLNEAAMLEQALVQYAFAVAMKYGWRVVAPPTLVYSHIADACGFQPRDANDEQQIWKIAQSQRDAGKPERSLAATAEIPLAALYASKDIPDTLLPLKLIGSSRCYRAEAGARGVDTKGLYRVHEFTKVEMFAWTDALDDDATSENFTLNSTLAFNEMLQIQIEILSSLGLPCRVLEMPSTDLGASAYRKIDIEALFPSRTTRDDGWGELTSVSICTDYQSRRLGTRILDRSGGRSRFPHTVNGTALAVPRVLAALIEHGWDADRQCIHIPKVLQPLMGGAAQIGPRG